MEREEKKKKERKGSSCGCHGGGRSLRVAQRDAEVIRAKAKPHHLFHMWTFLRSERNRPEILFLPPPPPSKRNKKKNLISHSLDTVDSTSYRRPAVAATPEFLMAITFATFFSCHVFGEIQEGPPDCARRSAEACFFNYYFFYDRRRDESGRRKLTVQLPPAGF